MNKLNYIKLKNTRLQYKNKAKHLTTSIERELYNHPANLFILSRNMYFFLTANRKYTRNFKKQEIFTQWQ